MDYERVKDAFGRYTSHYDCSDRRIMLKIAHTYSVAHLCRRIAEAEGLDGRDVDLAWLTGMLHDIGRFEQLKRFGTFVDADSIDHAQYGVEILFGGGRIHDFLDIEEGDADYGIIRTAVGSHSAYRVGEMDPRTRMFCDILRDADKVDILRVNHDEPLEVIYNVSEEELRGAVIADEVMRNFFERHAVPHSAKRTCVDSVVGHISLVFELVYPESLRIVREQGYLEKLLRFPSDNPVTRGQFEKLRECMEGYLRERL